MAEESRGAGRGGRNADAAWAALDALAEGVSLADRDGRIYYSNPAADRILGAPPTSEPADEWAKHYGTYLPDGFTPFPPDEYPLIRALGGEGTDDVEMLIRNEVHPNGNLIAVSGRPIRNADDELDGAAVVFRDITRLRNAQIAAGQALSDLERTIKTKDDLTRFLVHDFKNPIQAVLLTAELLLADPLPEDVREGVQEIMVSTRTLSRMVLNLLDIHVAEHGELAVEPEILALESLVHSALEDLRGRLKLAGVSVELELDTASERCLVDRELARRILVNVLDNCVKYGPSKGRIRIGSIGSDDGHVFVSVQDNGPGVPDELKHAIFEDYSRVERGPEGRERGSHGFGLRFCKLAAEAQGGDIWVEDVEPEGARFMIALPVPA